MNGYVPIGDIPIQATEKNSVFASGDALNLVVNASRIDSKGGLHTFAVALLECLQTFPQPVEVVLPQGVDVKSPIHTNRTPRWFAGSTNVSKLRPILWLFYSAFFFPARRGTHILSTTHHVLPLRPGQVVTVHDLRPLYEPDSWVQHFYFRYLLPRSLRRCDGILTVSQASKEVLILAYSIPAEKIHVVPNAIRLPPQSLPGTEHLLIPALPFLLMVGASWKHKNAVEMLQQHALWSSRYRLKIVAGKGQYLEHIKSTARAMQLEEKLDFIDSIDDKSLDILYATCSALVYPSRMEGFGLPPLEAMAHAKPVIVSDIPVMRELLGAVPLYVTLGDSTSWSTAFEDLREIEANPTHWRRSAGRQTAESYSLDRMRRALLFALNTIWNQ
jgi:glycosyltransferase involved in cell wall biosynthesis